MTKTLVVGGSGYTGAELLRLLARHPDLEVAQVTASSSAGAAIGAVYPGLGAAYEGIVFEGLDASTLADAEVAFVALPHGESQRWMPDLLARAGHVVDLGADFRLPREDYERWYGAEHSAPELLGDFAYGLPELFRDEIRGAQHVANPGCYPTAAALALAPVVARGWVDPTHLVVDAVSGVSGRGRKVDADNLFAEVNEAVAVYGLVDHRHTAEMDLALTKIGSSEARVLFTPHLAPMTRGLLATCYGREASEGLSTERLLATYREFYADEPFVVVTDEPVSTKGTLTANTVHITVRFDGRTGTVVAVAAEDNLGKGAAGQAIQNANLLLGLDETRGLDVVGLTP